MNYINTVNESEEGVYLFAEAPTFPLPSDKKMCTSVCLFVCWFVSLFVYGDVAKRLKKRSSENHLRREYVYEKGF